MKIVHAKALPLLVGLLILSHLSFSQPSPKYEFRAVWVATVDNIDWPSKKGLPVEEQKAEFIRLLDMNKRNGMNAIIMQIRPAADAFYPSQLEPWSEFLTGVQGKAPDPYYDPLQFMITETHKRGMEFHAWLNPYRAVFNIRRSSIAANHITRTHPDWFLTYGDKKYFDPGRPEVMQFVTNVVKDIVTRYDIDGIHMDDYFYPYRIAGREFPDNKTYEKYGNGLSKDDWRRSNCDSIIKMIHDVIVNTKPMVKFGISPFGVWRNKSKDPEGSDTRAGVSNYDDLYADILLWLKEGWIDYVAPQLYWEIGHPLCDYETLLDWWSKHSYGKHVYIGHGVYRSIENPNKAWLNPNELPEEITLLRETPNIEGSIFFSSKNFERNPNGWSDSLQLHYYQMPALVPPMKWVDTVAPKEPSITLAKDNVTPPDNVLQVSGNSIKTNETEKVKSYVLYISNDSSLLGKTPLIVNVADTSLHFTFNIWPTQVPDNWNNCYIAVSSVDKENNESSLSNVIRYVRTDKGWALKKTEADIYEAGVVK